MDKADAKIQENQSDTSSVITMKEYASSEYPNSEPPPAYIKPRSTALRIARLAAFTVIASSVILGGFILAASWIQANAARNLDLTLNQELLDDLHPSYEHLVAEETLPERKDENAIREDVKVLGRETSDPTEEKSDKKEELPFPAPRQEKKSLGLDEIANILMQKNIKGNVNCIIEKRRNEELVDHAPRSLNLPFGLNITTPPRLQHVTGEQMVVVCKNDEEGEGNKGDDDAEQQMTPIVLPLPAHLLNQIQHVQQNQQVQQHVPRTMFQGVPMQAPAPAQPQPQSYLPFQFRFPPHQPSPQLQQHPQQPYYQTPQVGQPQQFFYHRPIVYEPKQIDLRPPQVLQTPFGGGNEEGQDGRLATNDAFDYRVPLEPMAVNDVPLSMMPITHMPLKSEARPEDEFSPLRRLVPPHPQKARVENFGAEEMAFGGPAAFDRPTFHERQNRFPVFRRPTEEESSWARNRPRFPFPVRSSDDFPRNDENEEEERPVPVEGRFFRRPTVERRLPFSSFVRRPEPKIIRMIPLQIEAGKKIRFPDAKESAEAEENRLPVVAEITKITPVLGPKTNAVSAENPQEAGDGSNKPFPLPIDAILEAIFKGIGPLTNDGSSSPIDVKIERIEAEPARGSLGGKPLVFEKFEIAENDAAREKIPNGESRENPEPTTLMLNEESKEKSIEPADNGEGTPAPLSTPTPQAETERKENGENFLPEGRGRGARVFPIPRQVAEAEIFSVSDARADKSDNVQIPVEFSVSVKGPENLPIPSIEDRRGRNLNFDGPVEGEINVFPFPEGRAMKPLPVRPSEEIKPQTFTVDDAKSVRLYPVPRGAEEMRPHYVQPRSV